MNLNDLRRQRETIKAPAVSPANRQSGTQPLEGLVGQVKAEELKEAQALKKARPLWILAASLFLLLSLGIVCLPPAGLGFSRALFFTVLAAIYTLNAVLLMRKLRQLSRVDYTEPLRSFLDKAEQRCRFMRPQERWLAAGGLVLLGAVSGVYVAETVIRRHVGPEHQALGVALYCLGYLLLCAGAFWVTYRKWMQTKAPLLASIQALKAELEQEETSLPGEAGACPRTEADAS